MKATRKAYMRAYYESHKDGLLASMKKYRADNRDKINAKIKARIDEVRAYLKEFKESNPCCDCGGYFQACQMDLDHQRDKKYKISKANTMRLLKEELAKCELVCANCHRLRTHKDKTNYGYNRIKQGREISKV